MPVEKYGYSPAPGVDYEIPMSLHKHVPDGYKGVVDKSGNPKDGTDLRIVKRDNPEVEYKYPPPTIEAREWVDDNKEFLSKRNKLRQEQKQDLASSERARKRQDERNK